MMHAPSAWNWSLPISPISSYENESEVFNYSKDTLFLTGVLREILFPGLDLLYGVV